MSLFDPSQPMVIHSCPDCETLRREREPWMFELVLEGDREVDFFNWWRVNANTIPITLTTTRERRFSDYMRGPEPSKVTTIIRSPDKKMLALAKLFLM